MKLNEIKTVNQGEYDLKEGVIPVHLTMTLEQIVTDGQVTNNVQHFVMAGLVGLFKDGGPMRWPRDLNAYPMATGSDVLEAIKSLSATESTEMASWLLASLQNPARFESTPAACAATSPQQIADWMRLVLKHQD